MDTIQREEGRHLFGSNVFNYAWARPAYPERIFELLQAANGLYEGARVLEIGAGAGLATKRLAELGANPILVVEPDDRFNPALAELAQITGTTLEIVNRPFEEVEIEPEAFDLAVSATAFHWLAQAPALHKVAAALRPDGIWAMWWHVFGDPTCYDPFQRATDALLEPLARSPSLQGEQGHFALDEMARMDDIVATGQFGPPYFETMRWTLTLDLVQLRGLYATFSPIQIQPEPERERILDELVTIAQRDFAGVVERPIITAIYLAHRQ
jgi:SAM-dependent methyltransferase